MIDRTHRLSIRRQVEVLGIARSTVYALPRPIPERDLQLMKRIDRLHLEMPFAGSRMLRDLLAQEGLKVGRKHVATLMKRMGIEALYRKPRTTRKHPQHRVYPYLLRGLTIDRPNQVWAMDLTYIPMARGFVYLVAVLDWYSRKVLSWRVSITMDVHFCVAALEEAIALYGAPEIMNTDQGSQFTSQTFTGLPRNMASESAWTAKAPGGTRCSLNGCGDQSSTKKCIFTPTKRSLIPNWFGSLLRPV